MKQVFLDKASGQISLLEVPDPSPSGDRIVVRVEASLVSAGTENSILQESRQGLLGRLRAKPKLLRKGWQEWKVGGWDAVRKKIAAKTEGLTELGYSCAGRIVAAGENIPNLQPGQAVACAGSGYAVHAEYVSVPALLSTPVPGNLSMEQAAYATIGAIAIQGVRQSQARLGEEVAVVGLGLVGLLTTQILAATGCRVVGIDPSEEARHRGLGCGCRAVFSPDEASGVLAPAGIMQGMDAVVICAATNSSEPLELAGKIARSQGRIVMVGATGMTIPRDLYYQKELTFRLSRSYGPGRYDPLYEEQGLDYPRDFVRFTAQRNMETFLSLLADRKVQVESLTTHRFALEQAPEAYRLLGEPGHSRVGIILEYPRQPSVPGNFSLNLLPVARPKTGECGVAVIGGGQYAQNMILPLLRGRPEIRLRVLISNQPGKAAELARRFGFEAVSTRVEDVLHREDISAVFILTRHDSHAKLATQAMAAGKHVWVEKPLALNLEGLRAVLLAWSQRPSQRLVVGWNRPFSPLTKWLLDQAPSLPRQMLYRINAGPVASESWLHHPALGGGRLMGEGCHFFDFLSRASQAKAQAVWVQESPRLLCQSPGAQDFSALVEFAGGASGLLLYSSAGSPHMPKEYFEAFGEGWSGTIHNFEKADFFGASRRRSSKSLRQEKGQAALLDAFLYSILHEGPPPQPPTQILESSLLTFAAQVSLETKAPVQLGPLRSSLS